MVAATEQDKTMVEPAGCRILVRPQHETGGGVLLPEQRKTAGLSIGFVIAVGPGSMNNDGVILPMRTKRGDAILYDPRQVVELKGLGRKLVFLHDSQVVGYLRGPEIDALVEKAGLGPEEPTEEPPVEESEIDLLSVEQTKEGLGLHYTKPGPKLADLPDNGRAVCVDCGEPAAPDGVRVQDHDGILRTYCGVCGYKIASGLTEEGA